MVVVLDGADDDVVELADQLDDVTVLSWPERRGFAAALNAAARATTGECFAVLQDDARAQPGWLRSLVDTAARNPDAGVIGSLVLDSDGRVSWAGAVIGGDANTARPWIGEAPSRERFTEVIPVDFVPSPGMLVRRDAWLAVGGYDEEMYPIMNVDADFCTAAWDAGWQVLFDPGATVVHDTGGSTSSARFRTFVFERNREHFRAKWGRCFEGRPVFSNHEARRDDAGTPGGWRRSTDGRRPPGPEPSASEPGVYLRREQELLRAYIAELEHVVAMHGVQVDRLEAERADLAARHEELTRTYTDLRHRPWRSAARWVRRRLDRS